MLATDFDARAVVVWNGSEVGCNLVKFFEVIQYLCWGSPNLLGKVRPLFESQLGVARQDPPIQDVPLGGVQVLVPRPEHAETLWVEASTMWQSCGELSLQHEQPSIHLLRDGKEVSYSPVQCRWRTKGRGYMHTLQGLSYQRM